LGCNL